MIKWVFFDVGGVLLNEDPPMAAIFRHIWQGLRLKGARISFKDLMREREEIVANNPLLEVHYELGLRHLSLEDWRKILRGFLEETTPMLKDLCPAMPGLEFVIGKMGTQVRLGIIANQPDHIIRVLKCHGLWEPFEIKGISQLVGLSKPDLDFYRWAIRAAGCKAKNAVMIGDRIKYDVVPAQRVGMHTIWHDPGPWEKHYTPRDEFEQIYLESLQRQFEFRRKRGLQGIQPSAITRDTQGLLDALEQLVTDKQESTNCS